MKNTINPKSMLAVLAIAMCGTLSVHAQEKATLPVLGKAWVAINTTMLNVELGLNDVQ